MESWKDILRIFVDFSLQVPCILCSWKRIVWQFESIFKLLSKGQASPRLVCLCQAFRCSKAILVARETARKQEERKMYHKKQGLNNHSEDIKMTGFEAKPSSKRFALGFMINSTVRMQRWNLQTWFLDMSATSPPARLEADATERRSRVMAECLSSRITP